MKPSTVISAFLVTATHFLGAVAEDGKQPPKEAPKLGSPTPQGCFKSSGNMTDADLVATAVSSGKCREYCQKEKFTVFAMSSSTCKCGFAYPEKDSLTDDSACNFPCPAYPLEACGNLDGDVWSVFNSGDKLAVPYYEKEQTSTSAAPSATSTTTSQPSATNDPAATTSTEPEKDKEDSGPSIGPIVGGVVAGVVVVCGIVGGLFFFMRRRRNSEIEEEYRRNAAVNAFISGSKPPGSSAGSISMTDSRLDPIKAHRLSDGSIADNEDYSRKILRVTNA